MQASGPIAAELPCLETVDRYERWQQREGIPVVCGFDIEDLKELDPGTGG